MMSVRLFACWEIDPIRRWLERRSGNARLLALAACLGITGCATAPTEKRVRIIDVPMASVHSDIAFTMSTGIRQPIACAEGMMVCPSLSNNNPAVEFALRVQRIAVALQQGSQALYADIQQQVPAMFGSRFDVYVVENSQAGSASSANGRIALHSALGSLEASDGFLAFVIAREMGHVIGRHHEENSTASIVTSILINIIIPGASLLKSAISAGSSSLAAASRKDVQALEADAIALDLLKAAGFRPSSIFDALLRTPALADDSPWAAAFRKSSDNFLAEISRTEFAVAAVPGEPGLTPH